MPGLFWVEDVAPIVVAALERMNDRFSGGDIGRRGDVVHIAKAQQVIRLRFVGLGVQGVTENQKQIDLVAGNARADLLIAALRAVKKACDL